MTLEELEKELTIITAEMRALASRNRTLWIDKRQITEKIKEIINERYNVKITVNVNVMASNERDAQAIAEDMLFDNSYNIDNIKYEIEKDVS